MRSINIIIAVLLAGQAFGKVAQIRGNNNVEEADANALKVVPEVGKMFQNSLYPHSLS